MSSLSSPSSSAAPSAQRREDGARALVLVVDPDASSRSVLEVALARAGFDVWASDVGARLELTRTPDAVVVDASLGDDAVALLAAVRARPTGASVRVVLLAAPGVDAETWARAMGADGFLEKPAFARDVAALVRLELAGAGEAGVAFEASAQPPAQLLRALLSTRKSGVLRLAEGRAAVAFEAGRVTSAALGGGEGVEALVHALAFTTGSYLVELAAPRGVREWVCALPELVQRVMPRLARWARVRERSLPLDARLGVDFGTLAAWLDAMPDDINRVLQLFDGHRDVEQVIVDSPFDETLTLEVATRLYLMGVVTPVARSPEFIASLRMAPRLFEPRSPEAEALMQQLFEGAAEIRGVDDEPGLPDLEDWFQAPHGAGLDVTDPAGGWRAATPDELRLELAPELQAQIQAFDIPLHVEESPGGPDAVGSFARETTDAAPDAQGPMEVEVLRAASQPRGDSPPMWPAVAAERATPDAARTREVRVTPSEVAGWVASRAEPMVATAAGEAPETVGSAVEAVMGAAAPSAAVVGGRGLASLEPTPAQRAAGADWFSDVAVDVGDVAPAMRDVDEVVAVAGPSPEALEAAFFDDVPAEAPVVRRRARWSLLAVVAVAVVLLAAGFLVDAMRGPAPVEPPEPHFATMPAPPPPLIDVEEPTLLEADEPADVVPAAVDVSESLAEGRRLYEAGRYRQAASVLEQVIDDAPQSVTAWILLGLVRYDSMDVAGARAAADRVLAIDPDNARVQVLLATLAFDAGDYPAGRTALHRYLKLEPEGPFAADARALLAR